MILLTCIGAPGVLASRARVAEDLLRAVDRGFLSRVPVIVQTQGAPGFADLLQVELLGGRLGRIFQSIPAFSADLPLGAVLTLAALPRVARISPDRSIVGCWDYNIATVGADVAAEQYRVDGRGVGIAVIDSGIRPEADFAGRIAAFQDFVLGLSGPYDDCGHGTHVAGIVAGSGANSAPATGSTQMFRGAAPGAHLVVLKVLDAAGAGTVSRVIAAIDWCLANRQAYNLKVLNLSLGHPVRESSLTDPLSRACRAAVRAGLVVVVSAGNRGRDTLGNPAWGGITCPGNDPCVITVGASNTLQTPAGSDDVMTTYSSRGPTYLDQFAKPDLVAPGNKIVAVRAPQSFLDTLYPLNQVWPASYGASYLLPRYFVLSGTSMSAPLVSGAAALMLQRNPSLTPHTVKAALMYSARRLDLPLSAGLSRLTQGTGVLNVAGALEIASRIRADTPVGAAWLTGPLSGQSIQQGVVFPWAGEVVWDGRPARGDLLARRQEAWGLDVAWGDGVTWSGNVAWGEHTVWADAAWQSAVIWSDALVWGNNVAWGEYHLQLDLPILGGGD